MIAFALVGGASAEALRLLSSGIVVMTTDGNDKNGKAMLMAKEVRLAAKDANQEIGRLRGRLQ